MTQENHKPEPRLDNARKAWERDVLTPAIQRLPERDKKFLSASGDEIQRLYTPNDTRDQAYLDEIGFPGQYPFTRGVHPTMYRGRPWTIRQYVGFGTAEETNERYRYLLNQGTTGLSTAFDLPTQIGYDSDDPKAAGEVGRVGVAISTLREMEALFKGIPLDQVSTSMTINSTAAILLAMYLAVAEQAGVRATHLSGTIQNDILKEYIARGTYRFPPIPSLRLIRDSFAYCTKTMPKWNTISISGYHIREAGSTAAQEVAFTLANAVCYIETALKAGLEVDEFAPRLAFFFAAHSDLFEEVAKFRAARRLYARLMRERFGAKNPRSLMLRFHAQTNGVTLTAQQPDNNIVRVAIQALAALLGGTQSLHTNSKDEALALPTEDTVRLAVRTQQILAHESGVANTVDPLGGSYFVETLTDQLEAQAEQYMKEIDGLGGMVNAIEQGYIKQRIEQAAYEDRRSIDGGERIIVGVNKFQDQEAGSDYDIFTVPEDTERKQIEDLRRTKSCRDQDKVRRALDAIERVARSEDNLIPPILDAVRLYASVGEICQALQNVFGEHREAYH